MNKKAIFTLALVGLIVVVWLVTQYVFAPAQIQSTPLEDVVPMNAENSEYITVRIGENDRLYVNEIETSIVDIVPKIDSLSSVGYDDSEILLERSGTRIELMVELMDLIQNTDRKVILKDFN